MEKYGNVLNKLVPVRCSGDTLTHFLIISLEWETLETMNICLASLDIIC